jgi:hypothetical protein
MGGMFQDASTLAATGILAAVAMAILAGVSAFLGDPVINDEEFRQRLLSLTDAAGIADVALLAVGVILLLLTPDPPGGIARSLLLRINAGLAGIITLYAVIRALVLVSTGDTGFFFKIADLTSNVGVALAAATVTFYAAKESFLKERGQI